jgi:uncharacterized protein YcnI
MELLRTRTRLAVLLVASTGGLVLASSAFAHAHVSPPVVVSKAGQVFTLAVPTEKEDAATTKVELTPPSGFAIDSFGAAPGWKREVQSSGSGEDTAIQKVTWSGGNVPHEEATMFQFLASADNPGTYTFKVRQTYSDGTVVDWAGPESSDTPAPTIEARTSLGGGSGKTLGIAAVALAALALVAALAGLLVRSGGRTLA